MPPIETQFFTRSQTAWDAMLADLYRAEKSIDIEQYIFTHDEIGDQFIDVLIQKAKQGLVIRLLLDGVGSYSLYYSTLIDELRSFGIQIKFYNPVSPWRVTNFTSNFFRDHRKIMIVDGKIGHIGGVGIRADMALWKDRHVRIVGAQVVSDMAQSFEALWSGISRWSFLRLRRSAPEIVRHFNFITNAPVFGQRKLYYALLRKIQNAQKYIYLGTPYFIPDIRFFRALRHAAQRGVDVRIIVPEMGDHFFVAYAKGSYYTMALTSGIRMYHYQPVMMHAKYMVVDDEWVTTGSFNLDSLSFFYNHEANIASNDSLFVSKLKEFFYEDLRSCNELTLFVWEKRPFYQKCIETFTWPFHRIM